MRTQVGLAYLFARAADTIADTHRIDVTRRQHCLDLFREQFHTSDSSHHALEDIHAALDADQPVEADIMLLTKLNDCFALFHTLPTADQDRIRHLMRTLINGMDMDLNVFPPPSSSPDHRITYIEGTRFIHLLRGWVCWRVLDASLHRTYAFTRSLGCRNNVRTRHSIRKGAATDQYSQRHLQRSPKGTMLPSCFSPPTAPTHTRRFTHARRFSHRSPRFLCNSSILPSNTSIWDGNTHCQSHAARYGCALPAYGRSSSR